MMFNDGLKSCNKITWKTPKKLHDRLNEFFKFDFDPCPVNPDFNGLDIDWGKRNYVNPPYGRELPKWIKKAYEESNKHKLVVMLIPCRTDTRYWHEYVMKAYQVYFIKGRLRFDDCDQNAPFPSCIVVFDNYFCKKHRDNKPPMFLTFIP